MRISPVPFDLSQPDFPYSDITDDQIDAFCGLLSDPSTVTSLHEITESSNSVFKKIHFSLNHLLALRDSDTVAAKNVGITYYEVVASFAHSLPPNDIPAIELFESIHHDVAISQNDEQVTDAAKQSLPNFMHVIETTAKKYLPLSSVEHVISGAAFFNLLHRQVSPLAVLTFDAPPPKTFHQRDDPIKTPTPTQSINDVKRLQPGTPLSHLMQEIS